MRPILIAALIAVLAALAGTARAEPVAHRPSVLVERAEVTLGDIFEPAGARPETPVLRAPRPGQRLVLDARRLQRLAAQHGLEWAPVFGDESVIIERRSHVIAQAELARLISEALAADGGDTDLEIALSNRTPTIYIAFDQAPTLGIEELRYDSRSERFTAVVVAPANDPRAKRIRISGRAHRTERIPVLVHRMDKGEVITEADLEWRAVRSSRIRQRAITDPAELLGKHVRRSIKAGVAVQKGDVKELVLVSKGRPVLMVYRSPGMLLTALGQAIEDGAQGQLVRIVNLQSRAIVQAVVAGPDTVIVARGLQLGMN